MNMREHIGKDGLPMVAVEGTTAARTLAVAIGTPGLIDVPATGTNG